MKPASLVFDMLIISFRFNPPLFIVCPSKMAAKLNIEANMTARNAVIFLFMIVSLFAVVLLVGNLFHPFNVFAVDCSRDGNMSHCGGG